jgi:SAM-dependent methyltransferase
VSTDTVAGIWRRGQGVKVERLFAGHDRLNLYESDTGLIFFDPMIVGDGQFYSEYYTRQNVHNLLNYKGEHRVDYKRAAQYTPKGALLLDVGSGPGVFRGHLGHARYRGLDPYASAYADATIIRETLEDHATRCPEHYDVVTAFHVIEHVDAPRRYAEQMVRLLKPGGLLILAAPLHPSPLTEIPNFPINIPPHHVTWWNPRAFTALAKEIGLTVVEASELPPSPHQGFIFWMHRLLPVRTGEGADERYIAHRWSWHASLISAYLMAKVVSPFKAMPPNPRPVDAFLVARKG